MCIDLISSNELLDKLKLLKVVADSMNHLQKVDRNYRNVRLSVVEHTHCTQAH